MLIYYATKLKELVDKMEQGRLTPKEEEQLVQLIRWDNELENKLEAEGVAI